MSGPHATRASSPFLYQIPQKLEVIGCAQQVPYPVQEVVARYFSHHLLLGQVSLQVLYPEDNIHDGEVGVGTLGQLIVPGLLPSLQLGQQVG